MNKLLYFPHDDGATSLLGGKAASLAELNHEAIPPWFVLAPAACPSEELAQGDEPSMAPELAATLIAESEALVGADGLLAVRSSGVDEDGGSHSFAGQFASYLAVKPAEVPQRVCAVWKSAWSERVKAYRANHDLPPPCAPAVLIQQLVPAVFAGVAFAVDPVSGRNDHAVVAAVAGLGTVLVDGAADATTWRVNLSGDLADTHAAEQYCQDALTKEGMIRHELKQPATPCSDNSLITAVAELARRCSDSKGAPQDIEWAWDGEQLWLLQSRPITTYGKHVDPSARCALWDTSNIAESYGGTTTPLTYSFARSIYEAVYREFCQLMGVPAQVIQRKDAVFRGLLGLVRGRMHYNLLNWYRLLSCFPGYQLNRRFMEQMMGVKEPLSPAMEAEVAPPPAGFRERLVDGWRFARTLCGLGWAHLRINSRRRAFQARLDEALAEPSIPYSRQRPDQLEAAYRNLEDKLLLRWDAPLVNDFLAMIFYGMLKGICTKWCKDNNGSLQNDLIGGDGSVISAEPAKRMRAMAANIQADTTMVSLLQRGSVAEIQRALADYPLLARGINDYLDLFADRCLEELKLESATLRDDPVSLYRAIGHLAARDLSEQQDYAAIARTAAEERAGQQLGFAPLKKILFKWVLKHARARVRDRENLRFERTRLFGRVRHIFIELGKRYAAAGVLDDARDVFWLELHEVLGYVNGTIPCPDLRGLAAVRRQAQMSADAEAQPADRFTTYGWVFSGNTFAAEEGQSDSELDAEQRTGIGCCPGVVRGRAVVVRDPRGVELPADSILVAERTDPGWIMLFPAAAGLVVERGSLLSHSAIVARELGLPCAVSVPQATTWIQTGDLIELDGSSGLVRRMSENRDD